MTAPQAIGLVAAVIVVGLIVILTVRSRSQSAGGSYSDIRQQIISQAGSAAPSTATRPANLDTRLPYAALARLRSLPAPSKENWRDRFDAFNAVLDSIREELAAIDPEHDRYDLLSPARRALLSVYSLESEVNNGGFDQYFLNSSGDGAAFAPESFRLLGLGPVAALAESANAQLPGGPSPDRGTRLKQMDALPESARAAWETLSSQFFELPTPKGGFAESAGMAYILSHESEFFRGK